MKAKHIPLRKCISCGLKSSKENFIMIVRPPSKDSDVALSVFRGKNKKGGRSAYICFNLECLKKARKTQKVERILRSNLTAENYSSIERMLEGI